MKKLAMLLFVTVARQPAGSVTVAQDKTRGTIDLARDTVLEPERARQLSLSIRLSTLSQYMETKETVERCG